MARRLADLTPRQRRRVLAAITLRAGGVAAVLVGAYYAVPLSGTDGASALIRVGVGLVVVVAVAGWSARRIAVSDLPQARAAEALLLLLPLFVVIFAGAYVSLSSADPEAFSESLDHTDGLYFTTTVLSTVGFGDVVARSSVARVLVTVQMLLDLVFIAAVARVLVNVTQNRLSRDGDRPG